jgi:site-specific DNA-methyltransferase (adenine-specific)
VKPYYDDGSCVIYHGDCRDRALTSHIQIHHGVEVIVTDPPYGIRYSPSQNSRKAWGDKTFVGDVVVAGDDQAFDPTPWLVWPTVLLFGANHFADRLPTSAAWFVWDKRDGMTSNDFADCELIWTNLPGVARVFRHQWSGALRASERGEPRLHPTQKPLALMRWLISRCPDEGAVILDPFMGSGTTLRAAKDLDRKAIGIEIEERYCEIAAQRLGQEVLDLGTAA